MTHRFLFENPTKLRELVKELNSIGCCDLCVVRYLGVTEPNIYRDAQMVKKILTGDMKDSEMKNDSNSMINEDDGKESKYLKRNACIACLGLLQDGIQDQWLEKIAAEVISNGIEAISYCPALSLPISMQIRAYSIWFFLKKKFGDFIQPIEDLKPDGTNVKAVWKWICSSSLKHKVDPKSDWANAGNVKVEITPVYDDDEAECMVLHNFILKGKKNKGKSRNWNTVSRGSVEGSLKKMTPEVFFENFTCPPSIPSKSLSIDSIKCSHEPIFIAGRYCKFSRNLSQTPWIIDNVRKTESSVEELIAKEILLMFQATECKFSSSGREDVDVRMLGKGRPFCFELINPKRTIFTPDWMKTLQQKINSNTNLVSVRDIQLVEKKDVKILKQGETSKTKVYCALCILPGKSITEEHLKILNEFPLPIVLKQKTPVRVLHRRSLATRERRILEMSAIPVKNNSELFKVIMRTDAGTYVKEFVHGDFGRTQPNVAAIVGADADIMALDVLEVALDWPPVLDD